jgi:lipopolysaccharide/colanic/teichoic acid biosynthesis glycosyltransferase
MTRSFDLPQTERSRKTEKSIHQRYLLFKRAFDIIICLSALPVLLMVAGTIALVIVLDSPGSPFFVQERVGKDGRRFLLYKFRTMHANHDDRRDRAFMQAYVAGQLAAEQVTDIETRDARYKPIQRQDITSVGRLLRKASLDELPQIINILKGEMSLIGPRPNVPWEVEAYHDWHYERLDVLPGITGLAQVNGRSNITFDEIANYDIEYVRNLSFQMDIFIVLRTMQFVLTSEGAG